MLILIDYFLRISFFRCSFFDSPDFSSPDVARRRPLPFALSAHHRPPPAFAFFISLIFAIVSLPFFTMIYSIFR